MATQLQIRRGTTAQTNSFSGAEGELSVNTSTDTVHVHDGATAGGHALAKADGSNIATYAGSFTSLSVSGDIDIDGLANLDNVDIDGATNMAGALTVTGVTTLSSTLAVSGTAIAASFASAAGGTFTTAAGNDLNIVYPAGRSLFIKEGSEPHVTVDNAGQVGIGTVAPENLLHLKAGDNVTAILKIEGGKPTVTSVGEINAQLDFGSNDASVNGTGNVGGRIASVTEITNGAYVGMAFSTFKQDASPQLNEHLRIRADGNLGIGTSSITNPYSQANFTDVNINGVWGGVISFKLGGATKGWVGQRSSGNGDMVVGATANEDLLLYANNLEKVRILSTGGITFNGDTAQANALDDYEEGLVDLSITTTNGDATVSGPIRCAYVKIGDMVHVQGYTNTITISAGGTGPAIVTGLPFSTFAQSNTFGVAVFTHTNAFTGIVHNGYIDPNNSRIVPMVNSAAAATALSVGSVKYLMVSATYRSA